MSVSHSSPVLEILPIGSENRSLSRLFCPPTPLFVVPARGGTRSATEKRTNSLDVSTRRCGPKRTPLHAIGISALGKKFLHSLEAPFVGSLSWLHAVLPLARGAGGKEC